MQSAGVGWPPFLSFSFLFRAFSHRLARVFCSKILHARQLIEFEAINRAPSTTVTFNATKGIFSPSISFSIETLFIYSFFFFLTESFISEFKVRPRSNIIFAINSYFHEFLRGRNAVRKSSNEASKQKYQHANKNVNIGVGKG